MLIRKGTGYIRMIRKGIVSVNNIIKYVKPTPVGDYFITFKSLNPNVAFSLSTINSLKNWDGSIEYSTDKTTWNIWDGTNTLQATTIYLRGINNTVISGIGSYSSSKGFVLTTVSNNYIICEGNIENLLDYQTVANGQHPPMATYCFAYLFLNNTSLITCPEMPATTLATYCYRGMYRDCSNLETLPQLYAETILEMSYQSMFASCSKIKLSTTQDSEYIYEYRIPFGSGIGSASSNSLSSMFTATGGSFTGTPTVNTTYYTSNEIIT